MVEQTFEPSSFFILSRTLHYPETPLIYRRERSALPQAQRSHRIKPEPYSDTTETDMMKNLYISISVWSILFLTTGCNNDVFINDFLPEPIENFTLSETEQTKEVLFNSENWGLINISGYRGDYSMDAYTLNGEETYLPFKPKELGIVHCTSEFVDFRIEKRAENKLEFILNKNLFNDNLDIIVTVGNEYKEEQIELALSPTQKFRIDSVVYDWEKYTINSFGEIDLVESLIINNSHASQPVTFVFYPYRHSKRKIQFFPDDASSIRQDEIFERYFGVPLPQITIPDIAGSELVLNDTRIPFGPYTQYIDAGLDKELAVPVTIDAHDARKICVYNELEEYKIPYQIYASHPKTGEKLQFHGTLCCKNVIDYLILKEQLDDSEYE